MNSRVLPLLALMIAIATLFLYVSPMWSVGIADINANIALDDQALKAASDYTAQKSALADKRAAINSADIRRLEVFLPDSVDNVGLILDLNALAARSGLSLSNIDVSAVDSGATNTAAGGLASNPVGSANLSLSAIGTFTALQTFLRGIERSERLLDAQDIVVKGSDTGVYTYQMTLRLYRLL